MGISLAAAGAYIAIASAVATAATTFVQINQANKNAKATRDAQQANLLLQHEELTRQQEEVNRVAAEEKSDVVRRAEHQLGAVRAASTEFGATGSSLVRMLSEIGAVEGADISRIEANREGRVASLQAEKRAGSQGYVNTVTRAYNEASAAKTDAYLGFVGTGLQIAGSYYDRSVRADLAKNKAE